MIYLSIGLAGYKAAMKTGSLTPPAVARDPLSKAPKKSAPAHLAARDTLSTQTPLAVIGLAAIAMIFLINSHARPTTPREKVASIVCAECGTVIAVNRGAESTLPYAIQVQMLDGSLRTVKLLDTSLHVGDIVRVNGNALTLRATAS